MVDLDKLLEITHNTLEEVREMQKGIDFLKNEYKTNTFYFSDDGEPSMDDVIKTVFEYAWGKSIEYHKK